MLTIPAGAPGAPNSLQAGVTGKLPIVRTLDEQADSAARKCIMYYGPNNNPRLTIGPRNQVTVCLSHLFVTLRCLRVLFQVDAAGKIHLIDDLEEYEKTVHRSTWNAVNKFADELREKKIKIGFFSSTPQGGGVALVSANPTCADTCLSEADRIFKDATCVDPVPHSS